MATTTPTGGLFARTAAGKHTRNSGVVAKEIATFRKIKVLLLDTIGYYLILVVPSPPRFRCSMTDERCALCGVVCLILAAGGSQRSEAEQKPGSFPPAGAILSVKASHANVSGLFCNFEASQRAYWDALKSEFCPMITESSELVRQ